MIIYVRVPPMLKTAVERAAEASGQSVNTWMMRAAEAQLYKSKETEACMSHQPKQ